MTLEEKIDRLSADVALLADRQRRMDELYTEMAPILKEAMNAGIERLQGAEEAGYFRAGRAAMGAVDRVVRGSSPAELDALGDDLVRILDTLRAVTRPDVLRIAAEAAEIVENRDAMAPLGVVGLVRAGSDVEVQRGLAVLMEVLRHVGRAVRTERPIREEREATSCAVPARDAPAVADWNRAIGAALAEEAGVAMTDAHWALVEFARKEWQDTGTSPNIRRLSVATGTSTRDLYTLFPKAPGRTVARIAGIPKPAGCI